MELTDDERSEGIGWRLMGSFEWAAEWMVEMDDMNWRGSSQFQFGGEVVFLVWGGEPASSCGSTKRQGRMTKHRVMVCAYA